MTCHYCKRPITDKRYIYLWQPDSKQYAPVHTYHTQLNKIGKEPNAEVQTTEN